MKPTPAQHVALEVTRDFGGNGEGWAEVELQFTTRRRIPQYLESATCVAVFGACERRGWLVIGEGGPSITSDGLAAIR